MMRDDWFRHAAWSAGDQMDFFARLKRIRPGGNKAQYIRIQACHLEEAGLFEAAIELLDLLFRDFPERLELAQAHLQKALCLAELKEQAAAISEFRLSLQCERDIPNVQTACWLQFPWFIASQGLTELYDEALAILEEFNRNNRLVFPFERYSYAAIQALIAHSRGEIPEAREFARMAIAAAAARHSGFRYHPDVGLVEKTVSEIHEQLIALAGL